MSDDTASGERMTDAMLQGTVDRWTASRPEASTDDLEGRQTIDNEYLMAREILSLRTDLATKREAIEKAERKRDEAIAMLRNVAEDIRIRPDSYVWSVLRDEVDAFLAAFECKKETT